MSVFVFSAGFVTSAFVFSLVLVFAFVFELKFVSGVVGGVSVMTRFRASSQGLATRKNAPTRPPAPSNNTTRTAAIIHGSLDFFFGAGSGVDTADAGAAGCGGTGVGAAAITVSGAAAGGAGGGGGICCGAGGGVTGGMGGTAEITVSNSPVAG